jgi:hypothetical protein
MMAVDVTTAPKFAAGKPRMLFEGPYRRSSPVRGYDVAPDGRRFLMVDTSRDQPPPPATEMILVLNWFEELKRLAAPRAR